MLPRVFPSFSFAGSKPLALAAVQHLSAPSNAGELRILAAEGLSASWMKEFEAAFGMFFCCCFFFDSKFMVITRFGAS